MGCFKIVLDKLKNVQKKMGNLSAGKGNDEKFERLSEKSSDKLCKDGIPVWLEEANNPRVAMDFSNGIGRVVSDPAEVAEITRNERWGASYRPTRFLAVNPGPTETFTTGIHLTQGYFHGDTITREEAERLVLINGRDGAFLVRKSKNRQGWLVITYVFSRRALHQYIHPVILPDEDNKGGTYLATCDKETTFYDVHSLIEFHRLNKGPLYTQLTESIKDANQPDRTPPRERRQFAAPLDFPPWCRIQQPATPQAGPSRPSTLGQTSKYEETPKARRSSSAHRDPQSSSPNMPDITELSRELETQSIDDETSSKI